jgi:hypothetical protein
MGDHLFHSARAQQALFSSPSRTIYFKLIENKPRSFKRQSMTHFDIAPTILDALGYLNSPEDQFGLGISLFSNELGFDYYKKSLQSQVLTPKILNSSQTYNSFWFRNF